MEQDNKLTICQLSPRLSALLIKEQVDQNKLARSLGMHPAMLARMLANPDQVWPWVTLGKVFWSIGYRIEGLRISRIGENK